MKSFWLSWWDPIEGAIFEEQNCCCALVLAASESEAWAKADRYYPGAAKAERRFSHEHPIDWRPGDRFPLSSDQHARLVAAEANRG